jgi:hypothetical protein
MSPRDPHDPADPVPSRRKAAFESPLRKSFDATGATHSRRVRFGVSEVRLFVDTI